MNQNYFEPNPSYSGFDQPSQYPIDQSPPQEMSIQDMEDLKQKYLDEMQSIINQIQIKDYRNERIDIQQEANVSTHTPKPSRHFNYTYYDDDDDEESTIPLNEIISQLPQSIAITPVLPTMEPEDSLIMEDEHLRTIPEKESDEFIKSSVEDLVPIPSKSEDLSEDLSDIESKNDMPFCDDFTTFYNPLFDFNDDFTSSNDESLSDEAVPEENFKIYSSPLFDEEIISTKIDPHHFNAESDLIESLLNRDTSMVSSLKFDSLHEEFSGELAHIDLISPEIDEADFDPEEEIRLVEKLLYDNSSPRPPEEINSEYSDCNIREFSNF
ncbi:hypothetical protein Tco_1390725 [Tanacetum coccineum]